VLTALEAMDAGQQSDSRTAIDAVSGDGTGITIKSSFIAAQGINTFYASSYGASPAATASANVTALQAALDAADAAGGGIVVIDQAGDYLVNAGLTIYGKTRLIMTPGAALSKSGAFSQVLRNEGATSGVVDEDITLEGVRIKVNGVDTPDYSISGLRGHVEFYRVKNLVIRDFQINDIGVNMFGLHICTWENLAIENIEMNGGKDGIHLGAGDKGLIRNFRGVTLDDLINVAAYDWSRSNPVIGDITNLTIEKMTSASPHRIMVGSFDAWTNGRDYFTGEAVNAGGKVYIYEGSGGPLLTASVQPTHTSGTVTGADSIPWRYEFAGSATEINVRNLVFRDCKFTSQGILRDSYNGASAFSRNTTPGTEGNGEISGLLFENCEFAFGAVTGQGMLTGQGRIADLTMKNCRFSGDSWGALVIQNPWTIAADFASPQSTLVRIENCDFDMAAWISMFSSTITNWSVELTGTGNTIGGLGYIYTGVGDFRSNGFDLPVRFDVLQPHHGDRAKLWLPPSVYLSGWLVYGRGRWNYEDPREVRHAMRHCTPALYVSAGTSASAAVTDGNYFSMFVGTTAGGYGMARCSQITTQLSGYLTNFTQPFVLSGEYWGRAISGGAVRILYGVERSYQTSFVANAGSSPFAAKGIGIEFAQPDGTGTNQKARIIAHDGMDPVVSDWVDVGVQQFQRHYYYELHHKGDGTAELYLGFTQHYLNRDLYLPKTPSATLSGGPTGNGASATATSIWAVATGDNSTTPAALDIGGTFSFPRLEYPTF